MNKKSLKKSSNKNKVITVRLTDEQYSFLEEWKKRIEDKMEIEVPLGALLRKSLDKTIHNYNNQDIKYFNNKKFADLTKEEQEEKLKQAKSYIEDYINQMI